MSNSKEQDNHLVHAAAQLSGLINMVSCSDEPLEHLTGFELAMLLQAVLTNINGAIARS